MSTVKTIQLGGPRSAPRSINLRDLGFVGTVSEEAREEIRRAERRAARVLTTSHLYTFGGPQ